MNVLTFLYFRELGFVKQASIRQDWVSMRILGIRQKTEPTRNNGSTFLVLVRVKAS